MVSTLNICFLLHVFLTLTRAAMQLCAKFGDVRIIDRRKFPQVCEGTTDGQLGWRYICKDAWDGNEEDVLCKQLGFVGSESPVNSFKKKGNNEIKVSNLMCNTSTHKRIVDCPHADITGKCDYVANVQCMRCDNNDQCNGDGLCDTTTGQCHCNSTCNPGDVCVVGKCECVNGMSDCEVICQPSCTNGGACNSSSQCVCPSPYYGDVCQYETCEFPCINNGTCSSNGKCQCLDLYHGERCEFKSCSLSCPVGLCDRYGICVTPADNVTDRTVEMGITVTQASTPLPRSMQIVIYSSVAAAATCLLLGCATALVTAVLMWRSCRTSKDEVYEDMASLHSSQLSNSANSIQYDSNVWTHRGRISPYLVVGGGSNTDTPIPYYATVGSNANEYEYIDVAQCEYPAYVNTSEDIHTPYLIN